MGGRCSGNKSDTTQLNNVPNIGSITPVRNPTPKKSVKFSSIDTNVSSPHDILDDDFETEIIEVMNDCMASMSFNFPIEQHGTIDHVSNVRSDIYRHNILSDSSKQDTAKSNKKLYRHVSRDDIKQELRDQIIDRIKGSFELQTADWSPQSRKMAFSLVNAFIENLIDEQMNLSTPE